MAKKIIIIILIVFLCIIVVCGALYGIYHIGLPDENTVVYGSDNIVVPDSIEYEDTVIKTMSFNIRCFAIEKDKQNYWGNRKDHVTDLVLKYSPDIVGFQEVTHPQYKYLIEKLGDDYNYLGVTRNGFGLERGDKLMKKTSPKVNVFNQIGTSIISESTAVFYKKSRFEVLDYNTLWLSETPEKLSKGWDSSFKRICTKVEFKDHYTNKEFLFMNTHLDHKGDVARLKSVELLNEWATENERTIVMGDMNFLEKCELYDNITSGVLSDTKYLAPTDNTDTGISFNGYGTTTKTEPIDFILTRENTADVLSYKIIRDKYDDDNYISDHYPLMSEIVLK